MDYRFEYGMDPKQVIRDMGLRIALRRRETGMTQEELADRMDVSPQTISYVETGKKSIRPENLIKLCTALDVSADYLLTGSVSDAEYNEVCKKLALLTPEQFGYVKGIIDNCVLLAQSREK